MDSWIGVELGGRYRVERFVADEMLGRVYAVRSLADGQLYHAKIPHGAVSVSAEKSERFRREFQATSLIDSPHTVRVHDTDVHEGTAFLVLEYLAAQPLQKLLDKKEPLPVERVGSIMAQVARALQAAHRVGVVHRNLSPSTILLLENSASGDFVKVSDFGLSRITEDEDDSEDNGHLTQAGSRIGNILYMAPEYIEQEEVQAKGDLYGLGAVAFHLLTGQPPFSGKASEVLSKHVTDAPPRLSSLRRDIPSWMEELVGSMLAKDPDRRPDPAALLQRLEASLGKAVEDPKLLRVGKDGAVIRPSKAPMVVAAIGAGVLVLGGGAFLVALLLAGGAWMAVRMDQWAGSDTQILQPLPAGGLDPAGIPEAPPTAVPGQVEPAAPSPAPAAGGPSPGGAPSAPVSGQAMLQVRSAQRAVVWIDDQLAGYTPVDRPVDPGTHKIVTMLPGKPETRQQKDVRATGSAPTLVEFGF